MRLATLLRQLFLPVLILAVAIAGIVMADRANEATNPGASTAISTDLSLESPILSARRTPAWLRGPKADSLLSEAVGRVLIRIPDASCMLVERDGVPIAANNVSAPIRPGDLHRLLTVTALDALSSDAGFRTEVAIATGAVIEEGTLEGDVWLIGGGDPVLSTSDYISRFGDSRAHTDFATLAADTVTALRRRGITTINGRIIGDETKYTPVERDYVGTEAVDPSGEPTVVWTAEDAADNAVGPLSALLLNDGFDAWPENIDATLNERSDNPAISAATALDNALEEAEITISNSPTDGEAPALAERDTLAVIDSPPLSSIIERAFIDATTAEMLLKEIGVRSGLGPERGLAIFSLVLADGFSRAGLPFRVGSTHYLDGSGRSDLDRTTCEMLHAAIEDPDDVGAETLPIAPSTPVAPCVPAGASTMRVYATVTATTTGLAGHYTTENGDRVTFTLMVDDPDRVADPENARPFESCNTIQTALLDAVAGHPYGPALDELSPLTPGS